jgi:hypothetical protein
VLSGKTLRSGKALHVQVGWPGAAVTFLAAVADKFDLGARGALNYAFEGNTRIVGVPGAKFEGVMRVQVFEQGKLNFGLKFTPGLFLYFFPGVVEFGLTLPFAATFGVLIAPKLMLSFGVDVPIFVLFGPGGGVALPVLFGGGLEYAIDNRLGFTVNLRTGPLLPLTGGSWYWCYDALGRPVRCGGGVRFTDFVAEALFGLSIRL